MYALQLHCYFSGFSKPTLLRTKLHTHPDRRTKLVELSSVFFLLVAYSGRSQWGPSLLVACSFQPVGPHHWLHCYNYSEGGGSPILLLDRLVFIVLRAPIPPSLVPALTTIVTNHKLLWVIHSTIQPVHHMWV